MILASWKAIPKKKLSEFLKGPAKVYDGAFDFDIIDKFSTQLEFGKPFSFLVTLNHNPKSGLVPILDVGSPRVTEDQYIRLFFDNNRVQWIFNNRDQNNRITILTLSSISEGKNIIVGTYAGDRDANSLNIYFNGKLQAKDIINNTLTGDFTSPRINRTKIGSDEFLRFLDADIKQLEIINRVATPQEIADASDPITGGSFQSAGIARNSGEYLFALNTDQADGNPPTTFPDTPQYTITSFGGAEYVNYEDL